MKARKNTLILVSIICFAAFLRLSHLDLTEFQGDEGSNCMVMWRMIQDHYFPLLGPQSSVGGYHFGPLMYYVLYPFFYLVTPSPRGASIVVGVMNVLAVYLCYRLGRELFNENVGLISSALFAASPLAVIFSAKFWNYDFLPFAVTALFYSLARIIMKDQRFWVPLFTSFAIAFQSHGTALALAPAVLLTLILLTLRRGFRPSYRYLALGLAVYLAVYTPVLCHELTSSFADTRLFLAWAFGSSGTGRKSSTQVINILAYYYTAVIAPTSKNLSDMYMGFEGEVYPDAQNFLEIIIFATSLAVMILRFRTNIAYPMLCTWALAPPAIYFAAQIWNLSYFTILHPVQYLVAAVLLDGITRRGRVTKRLSSIKIGSLATIILTLFIVGGQATQMYTFYSQIQAHGGGLADYGSILSDREKAADYIVQSAAGEAFKVLYVVPRGEDPYRYLLLIRSAKMDINSRICYVIIDPVVIDPFSSLNPYHIVDPTYLTTDPGNSKAYVFVAPLVQQSVEQRRFGLVAVYRVLT